MANLKSFLDQKPEFIGILAMTFVMVSIGLGWPITWTQATTMAIAMMTYLGDRLSKIGPTGAEFE